MALVVIVGLCLFFFKVYHKEELAFFWYTGVGLVITGLEFLIGVVFFNGLAGMLSGLILLVINLSAAAVTLGLVFAFWFLAKGAKRLFSWELWRELGTWLIAGDKAVVRKNES